MGALTLIRALPLIWQLGVAAAAIGALGVGYGVWHHKVYQSGWDAAIADVAADNAEAVNAANQARARVRDCNGNDGMRWDQVARQCVRRD